MIYVRVVFFPGGAGNFLMRALSLNDYVYSYILNKNLIHTDQTKKLQLFSYVNQDTSRWHRFETQLNGITEVLAVEEYEEKLPENAVIAHFCHSIIDYNYIEACRGRDDRVDNIVIGCRTEEAAKWLIVNGIAKDSLVGMSSGEYYANSIESQDLQIEFLKKSFENRSYIQIDLEEFFKKETFISMYKEVCDKLDIEISRRHYLEVVELYNQWIETHIDPVNFKLPIKYEEYYKSFIPKLIRK